MAIPHEDFTLDVQRVLFDSTPPRRLPAPCPGPATTDNGTTVSLTIIIYEYGYIWGCRWHPDVFLTGGHVHGFRQRLSMLPALLLCAAWQCAIRPASCRTSPRIWPATGPWPVPSGGDWGVHGFTRVDRIRSVIRCSESSLRRRLLWGKVAVTIFYNVWVAIRRVSGLWGNK